MAYTRAQALARALKSRTYPKGMCYQWTRLQFGLPAVGDVDHDGDADAVDGWMAARHRHPGDRTPPAGVPVFWSGGSRGHGHAAIATGKGAIRSIDAAGFGNVGTVPLSWVERNWGLTYLGWSEDLGGKVIPNPAPVKVPLRAAELSGRFDKTPASLDKSIRAVAPVNDIILLTEVAGVERRKVLDYAGWTTLQDRDPQYMGECAILVRDKTWRVKRWAAFKVAPDLGPGGPVVVVLADLQHVDTGARLLVGTGHFPSSVERTWVARGRRVLAYHAGIRETRRIVADWWDEDVHDAALFSPDWNLNLRRAWVRGYIRSAWPGLRPVKPSLTPKTGTHEGRLIDWPIARHLPGFRFTVLDKGDASDHRGIQIRGTITKENQK